MCLALKEIISYRYAFTLTDRILFLIKPTMILCTILMARKG